MSHKGDHHMSQHDLLIFIVGILGNLVSVLVYLAPLPTYRRIYRRKSTEGFQSVPYVVAVFSAMLWIYYALLKTKEYFIVSINSAGCIIETLYIAFYCFYASKQARIYTVTLFISLNVVIFAAIVFIVQFVADDISTQIQVLGIICAVVSTTVFAAPLTIIMKVIRTKSVEFMPFPLSFFLTLCAVIWFVYGILRNDIYIYIPNVFGFVLGLLQMVLYAVCRFCYHSNESEQRNLGNSVPNNRVNGNSTIADHHHQQTNSEQQENRQMAAKQDGKNGIDIELQLSTVSPSVV